MNASGAAPAAVNPDTGSARNYLTTGRGVLSWMLTLDHKRIGVMYLVGISSCFLFGGIFALLIRTQHLMPSTSDAGVVSPDTYNMLFTVHGAVMIFLVIIPGIPAGLGNFVLPLMLGAKDVAFPRLNLLSFYLWCFGAVFLVATLMTGGVDTGWTFYTPYSIVGIGSTKAMPIYLALTGAFVVGFSSILTGLNFIVTIHRLRPEWMDWFHLPLFLWGLYATAVIQILATPVLAITLLLLIVENAFGIGIFDPGLGGDPVLFQHFFWFYSHPAVYIMILPGMGIVSELISVHSHKHIFGYRFIAYSSIAIAMFGFLVWGHHMFTSNMSGLVNAIFSFLTFSVSIPSAIKVFNWLATMYRGNLSLNTPMLWTLGFIFNFTIGGLTGLFFATLNTDIHLHDTYFVVAHFHYTMMGGTLFAFFAGFFHWWPKISGRMFDDRVGLVAFWLIFVGFNATFIPQFVMGSQGMPRRYFTYDETYTLWHVLSTCGSYLMSVGFFVALYCMVQSLMAGRPAPANPWGGNSLEWHCSSPPPPDNFDEIPVVHDSYDASDWTFVPEQRGYVLRASE